MSKLKKLSGKDVISILNLFGFDVINQKGSHVKLRRFKENMKQTLLIPNHKEIDTGTLRAIVRQAAKYIPIEELNQQFYS
ncbi:MAG: type II toxin-antitoxin system HicA family toxin [Ignavibacteria bacterium]|nr:type II toxin-antitoxin system HicA family toxin [Ignavibacteriota bacterium]